MSNFLQVQENLRHCAEAYSRTPHKRYRQTCNAFSVIDAEIAEKGHLWTETNWKFMEKDDKAVQAA